MNTKPDLISQIELYRCPVKLKEPFIISLGKLEFADNVFVIIKTKDGVTGFGECSPFQTIHGENGETCMAVGKILAEKLLARSADDIEGNSLLMDSIFYGNTSIKSAFDIALHDIASQKAGVPLYKFLGGKADKKMATDYTVSIDTPEKMSADALKIVHAGFPVIKVKLGGREEDDFNRMNSIRKAVGNEIPIRIDANQGWTFDAAVRILDRFEQFNIQHCEEPLPRSMFMQLSELRNKIKIPLMADESCFDNNDAERLININACSLFNIKLGKSSGIFKARKIVKVAEENDINLQAGGFLESRLGFTATAHLALSSDNFLYFDFDTPLMFSEDPVDGGIEYHSNGVIQVPNAPGLGATIPHHYLKKLEAIVIN